MRWYASSLPFKNIPLFTSSKTPTFPIPTILPKTSPSPHKTQQAYYVVMQKCGGGELFDFLLNETDVPERECKRIMREILRAVDHLHSQGLIHRDIKPENVMFIDQQVGLCFGEIFRRMQEECEKNAKIP